MGRLIQYQWWEVSPTCLLIKADETFRGGTTTTDSEEYVTKMRSEYEAEPREIGAEYISEQQAAAAAHSVVIALLSPSQLQSHAHYLAFSHTIVLSHTIL